MTGYVAAGDVDGDDDGAAAAVAAAAAPAADAVVVAERASLRADILSNDASQSGRAAAKPCRKAP